MSRRAGLAAAVVAAFLAVAGAAAAPPTVDLTLRGLDGRRVQASDLPGKWLIVYFGYTYCPDVCPTALADLVAVLHELGGLADRVQPVFVTIDPERDTPETLALYLSNFDAPILALTGTAEEIAAAAQQFHVHYVRYQDPSLGDYSLDHSSSLFLVDPERRLVADFATPELAVDEIVAGLRERLDPATLGAVRDRAGRRSPP
jgi:protein SCO1/2